MIDQISSAFPLVGGSAIGFGVGYVIKKLMKLAFIGLGLVMLLGFLEYKHWISVNWTVTENQSTAILTHLANKIATVTQHMNHEIPIGVGGYNGVYALGDCASITDPHTGKSYPPTAQHAIREGKVVENIM